MCMIDIAAACGQTLFCVGCLFSCSSTSAQRWFSDGDPHPGREKERGEREKEREVLLTVKLPNCPNSLWPSSNPLDVLTMTDNLITETNSFLSVMLLSYLKTLTAVTLKKEDTNLK